MVPSPDRSIGFGNRLAFASASVGGNTVVPEDWTAYFGVSPDFAHLKGERFMTPRGQLSRAPHRTSMWGIRSENAVKSDLLEPHIRYLVDRLGLPRRDMPARLAAACGRFRIFCFWANDSGDRVPVVGAELQDIVASSGGVIEIDEYPSPNFPRDDE